MLEKLSFKKEYRLVLLVLFLLAMSWFFAFKKTVASWRLNRQLAVQMEQVSDLSVQPSYLMRKAANLGRTIAFFKVNTQDYRSRLLGRLGELAELEKVRVLEVPTEAGDSYYSTPLFTIEKLSFEGDFFALERFLNRLGKVEGIGFIRSAEFKVTEQHTFAGSRKSLSMEVYLETVK